MRCVWLFGTAVPVIALALISLIEVPPRLVFNGSASAPIGLYWVTHEPNKPFGRGDYVLASVPEEVRNLVEERGYLPPGAPLIKQVVGMAGDEICRREREILVNGVTETVARWTDEAGRPLPVWEGCQTLNCDQLFLLQDDIRSFDGRYFGPVDRDSVMGRAEPWPFPWWASNQD